MMMILLRSQIDILVPLLRDGSYKKNYRNTVILVVSISRYCLLYLSAPFYPSAMAWAHLQSI